MILVAALPTSGSRLVGKYATALQPVANRPILSHVLDALRAAAVEEVIVVVPAMLSAEVRARMAEERPPDVRIRYVVHENGRDAWDALRSAAAHVGDAPCIVHRGHGLLAQPLAPLVELLDQGSTDLLLLVHPGASKAERVGTAARRLLRIAEVNSARTALGLAGVYLFGPGALCRAGEAKRLPGAQPDLTAMAEGFVTAGGRLDVQIVRGWRCYAGDVGDLLELNRATLDALSPDHELAGDGDNKIEGRVAIHGTARLTSSVIVGPAIIGAGACVTDAYVGPYTSIGAGARIEGVEVESSIISPGASITHFGGRLVASVVGCNARIFRDFSLPRAMRLRVGDDAEVALS